MRYLLITVLLILAEKVTPLTIFEDFITATYKDEKATTADWNTKDGVLKLLKHAGIVDQQYTNHYLNQWGAIFGRHRVVAQTFTSGISVNQIGKIELFLAYRSGKPVDILLTITETTPDGLFPSNVVIATATIPAFSEPVWPNFTWKVVEFPQPVTIKPKTKYAIVLSCFDAENYYTYTWAAGYEPNNYPGGTRLTSKDYGQTWVTSAWEDFLFKTYSPERYTIEPGVVMTGIGQSLGYDSGYTSVRYLGFTASSTVPQGTKIEFLFSDSADNVKFGAYVDGTWQENAWTNDIIKLSKRFIRFKAILSTQDPYSTPIIDWLAIDYTRIPPPEIYSINPNSGPLNGGIYVEINGYNLLSDTKVMFGNKESAQIRYINPQKILALVPESNSLKTVDVTIVNPDNQSTNLANAFTYLNYFFEDFFDDTKRNSLNTNSFWDTNSGLLTLPKSPSINPLIQFTNQTQNYGSGLGEMRVLAQTFTLKEDTEIEKIEFYLAYGIGKPVDIDVLICETDENGTPIIAKTIARSKIYAFDTPAYPQYSWKSALLSPPVKLVAKKTYAIVLKTDSEARATYVWAWGYVYPHGFEGGQKYVSFDYGKNFTRETYYVHLFKVFPPTNEYGLASVAQTTSYNTTFGLINYKQISINQKTPQGTNIKIYVSESSDSSTWSEWVDVNSLYLLSKQFIRLKMHLSTNDPLKTPVLDSIRIDFLFKHISDDQKIVVSAPVPKLTIVKVSTPAISSFAIKQNPIFISEIYDINPNGTTLREPAILKFYYTEPLPEGVKETDLNVYRFNPETGWELIPAIERNFVENYITVEVYSFSLFTILSFDKTPPELKIMSPLDKQFLSGATEISLLAKDNRAIEKIILKIDGEVIHIFKHIPYKFNLNTRTLPDGLYKLEFTAYDTSNNSTTKTITVYIDNTPPSISIDSPKQNEKFIAKINRIKFVYNITDNLDISPHQEANLLHMPSGKIYNQFPLEIDPLDIPYGIYKFTITAKDKAGNTSTESITFEVLHDILPPRTKIEILEPKYLHENIFITPMTEIKFFAVDDLIDPFDESGLGVDKIYILLNGQELIYTGFFNLPFEGEYSLSYYSVDVVGNIEEQKTIKLVVDNTPPVSRISFEGAKFEYDDRTYINQQTKIILTAYDKPTDTPACGVKNILYSINDEKFTVYENPISLTEGKYTLRYFAMDNLGNVEQEKTLIICVDATAPSTEIIIGKPKFTAFGILYISPKTNITLIAKDEKETDSGVKVTQYEINNEFITYISPFTLPEGKHILKYRSIDNVGNIEKEKAIILFVTTILDYTLAASEEIRLNGKAIIFGDAITNGIATLKGNTEINGNLYCQTVNICKNAKINGEIIQNSIRLNPYPINLEEILVFVIKNNDNNKIPLTKNNKKAVDEKNNFKISGKDSITLSQGIYYFNGIHLSGDGVVNIEGAVSIFCDGDLKISGNATLNSGGNACNLIIFANGKEVKLDGNSMLNAIIYAPNSEIKLNGNATAYGNLFCKKAELNGNTTVRPSTAKPASIKSAKIAELHIDSEFEFKEIYSFPNPAKLTNPTIYINCGNADKVEIKIFDISGSIVHSITIKESRPYYEYTWDVSNIASGIYIYIVEAEKNGYTPIKAIKKLAVIK